MNKTGHTNIYSASHHSCRQNNWLNKYPDQLLKALAAVSRKQGNTLHITGGAVRSCLLDMVTQDIDITVPQNGFDTARLLANELRGTFVPLDTKEDVARVVWQKFTIDFAAFRENTTTITADLKKRDFTINALAIALDPDNIIEFSEQQIIDPTGGLNDLKHGIVRATSDTIFLSDPLRMLRAYRFMAVLGFTIIENTAQLIHNQAALLNKVSAERIAYEFNKIMETNRCHDIVTAMAASGLLWTVFPELTKGVGMTQPANHHLDVFAHNLETLKWMTIIQQNPNAYYPNNGKQIEQYLASLHTKTRLKWAALFHDLGKPATRKLRNKRITFYNHDRTGANEFANIARRLKWSKKESKHVCRLIALHMWPFHLSNAQFKTGITLKACLRLTKAADDDLAGLFMLAMADTLAGQGANKPPAMEMTLSNLYDEVSRIYKKSIKPVLVGVRLLTGHDLKHVFDLAPGPIYKQIFMGLEQAQVVGQVHTRQEALRWVDLFLKIN